MATNPNHTVAGASLGYVPPPPRPALPPRPTSATAGLLRDALVSRGHTGIIATAAILPAGGWVRLQVDGNAKLDITKRVAAEVLRLCLAWGLEARSETASNVLARGVWTPTRQDIRGEASRAMRVWLEEERKTPLSAWIRHDGPTTLVEGYGPGAADDAAAWLVAWLDGIGLATTCAPARLVGQVWVTEMVVRRKEAA